MRGPSLVGEVFGTWTVLEFLGQNKHRQSDWLCQCECGETKTLSTNRLRMDPPHCSLTRWDSRRHENGYIKNVYQNFRGGARARGYDWDLSLDFVEQLIVQPCEYCGLEPVEVYVPSRRAGTHQFPVNGIDRVDNRYGYLEWNVVACCSTCNHAKADLSLDEWNSWLERITSWRLSQ